MQTLITRKKKGFQFVEADFPHTGRPPSSKQILSAIEVDGRTPELMSALLKAQAREAHWTPSRKDRRKLRRKGVRL